MVALNVTHALYVILLSGSLAFGLEALLIGLGGRLTVIYHRGRGRLLKLALPLGLTIAGLSIWISMLLSLEPLYLCVLVLACTFVAGKIINLSRSRLFKPRALPPPPASPEKELKLMLKERGFSKLVKEKKRQKKKR
ncbi:MAG: hypothetical protein U9M97_03430 [Candidatus Hadarchaeota archaeon]|nr:hypothetical protein [Candidatus Hadarchaeota archaeon]